MRARFPHVVVAAVLSALFAGEAAAQVGRVNGIVKDDGGNPIKGATVTADNPNVGPTTYTATTDDKGRFTIIGLRAGQWRLHRGRPWTCRRHRQFVSSLRIAEPRPRLYPAEKWSAGDGAARQRDRA
jgi:hypothetical protein